MKRIYIFAFLAACVALIARGPQLVEAAGHIASGNVVPELRTQEVRYTLYTPDVASNNTTDVTPGISGVVGVIAFGSGSNKTLTQSSTLSALPYPCKLMVYVKDDDTNSALTCTGDIVLCGNNQFGVPVDRTDGCESISTDLVEGTAVKSERVFDSLASISVTACSGATDGATGGDGDKLIVSCSPDVGLPYKIKSAGAVLRVCVGEDSDDLQCFKGTGVSDDIDILDAAISFNGGINSGGVGEAADDGATITVDDNDLVTLRVRAIAAQ